MNKKITIALVGQPNVGKSMLINSISNAHLKVGNFTGVTVEKKEVIFTHKNYNIHIVDLPGTYSLNEFAQDEKVTKLFLENEHYDLILNVLDATNLERNLNLTTQLFSMHKKMLIAVNMMDEAKEEGIVLNIKQLESILGVNTLPVSALKKEGIDDLLERLILVYESENRSSKMIFSDPVEEEIDNIVYFLKEKNVKFNNSYRMIAEGLLSGDQAIFSTLHDHPIWIELHDIVKEGLEHLYIHFETKDVEDIFVEERASFARGVTQEIIKYKNNIVKTTSDKIDMFLIHPVFGIPIFLFFMWGLFQLTFEIGSIPMEYIDVFFGFLGDGVGAIISHDGLRSLLVDGIIAGVGAVVLFLPNIVILFLGIALLESTGYMSRVAFILDGFFHKFGLHGKSFIPLVTGFGCSIPAYMSARILKNEKDRLITLFIIGFMSCGARLPVYVLFVGAFFSTEEAGNILFAIYMGGALLGLLMAKVLKMTAFKGKDEPFVMEMPKYRWPSMYLIWHTVYSKALMYLKKAGTFILVATIFIWFASNYPKNNIIEDLYAQKIEQANTKIDKQKLNNELSEKLLEQSYLGQIGKLSEPFFEPIGLDWKLAVALETGLAAKEVVVATLGVLYALGEDIDESNEGLMTALRENISIASALSFIVFVMIYLPCLAASVVFVKEAGSYKYFIYLFAFTTITAYILAFLTYRVAKLFLE